MNNKKLKENHFMARVWDNVLYDSREVCYAIVVDVCGRGCIVVEEDNETQYFDKKQYNTVMCDNYKRIEEPKRRDMLPVELAGKWVNNKGWLEKIVKIDEGRLQFNGEWMNVHRVSSRGYSWSDTPDGEFSDDFTVEVE